MVYLIVYYLPIILKIPDIFSLFLASPEKNSYSVRMDAIPVSSGNGLEYLQNAISLTLRLSFLFSYFIDK